MITVGRRVRSAQAVSLVRQSNERIRRGDASIEAKGTVLVVDDEPDIRELIGDTLRYYGYTILSAGGADVAMTLVRKEKPDVITLDLAMPRRDGQSLIDELAADVLTCRIPIVVVSAYTGNLVRTPQISCVLPKPFDVDDLVQAVGRAVPEKHG